MFIKRQVVFAVTLISLLIITVSCFAGVKISKTENQGEETVKVGDTWRLITPATFDCNNYDIVEKYNNNGIRFTQTGDVTVTAYYRDEMSSKFYAKVKTFHIIPSEKYGNSIVSVIPDENAAQEILEFANQKRAEKGLKALVLDEKLCDKAKKYANKYKVIGFATFYGGLFDEIIHPKDKDYKFINNQSRIMEIPFPLLEDTLGKEFVQSLKRGSDPSVYMKLDPSYYTQELAQKAADDDIKDFLHPKARYLGVGFATNSDLEHNSYTKTYQMICLFATAKK